MEEQVSAKYRPNWDDYFMAICRIVATRSSCDRLNAGAVLVKHNRIISTGYNGSPVGLPHCDDAGHLLEEGHCVRTIHAEHNALLQAAVLGSTSTQDSTMYLLYTPCIHCCKYIVACGVKRVVAEKVYRNTQAIDYLRDAGVHFDLYEPNARWKTELQDIFSQELVDKKAPPVKFTIKK